MLCTLSALSQFSLHFETGFVKKSLFYNEGNWVTFLKHTNDYLILLLCAVNVKINNQCTFYTLQHYTSPQQREPLQCEKFISSPVSQRTIKWPIRLNKSGPGASPAYHYYPSRYESSGQNNCTHYSAIVFKLTQH